MPEPSYELPTTMVGVDACYSDSNRVFPCMNVCVGLAMSNKMY